MQHDCVEAHQDTVAIAREKLVHSSPSLILKVYLDFRPEVPFWQVERSALLESI